MYSYPSFPAVQTQGVIGGTPGDGFQNYIADTSPGASQNDYAPSGYMPGATNAIGITANAGGTTLTGLLAVVSAGIQVALQDGYQLRIVNKSATDSITFKHLSSSSAVANRFSCPAAGDAILDPDATVVLRYIPAIGWTFT